MKLLVNIDVDDLEKATRFYCDGLGLTVGTGGTGSLCAPDRVADASSTT